MEERIEIPESVKLSLEGKVVKIEGPRGSLVKTFDFPGVSLGVEGRSIVIRSATSRRKEKAMIGTICAHLRNAFKGVTQGWTQRLKIVYSHFPIEVKVEKGIILVKNFLGEKSPRVAEILGNTQVRVEGDEVIVEGVDKYEVGQTAWNLEKATRIKRKDPRVFQDGIYRIT